MRGGDAENARGLVCESHLRRTSGGILGVDGTSTNVDYEVSTARFKQTLHAIGYVPYQVLNLMCFWKCLVFVDNMEAVFLGGRGRMPTDAGCQVCHRPLASTTLCSAFFCGPRTAPRSI